MFVLNDGVVFGLGHGWEAVWPELPDHNPKSYVCNFRFDYILASVWDKKCPGQPPVWTNHNTDTKKMNNTVQ